MITLPTASMSSEEISESRGLPSELLPGAGALARIQPQAVHATLAVEISEEKAEGSRLNAEVGMADDLAFCLQPSAFPILASDRLPQPAGEDASTQLSSPGCERATTLSAFSLQPSALTLTPAAEPWTNSPSSPLSGADTAGVSPSPNSDGPKTLRQTREAYRRYRLVMMWHALRAQGLKPIDAAHEIVVSTDPYCSRTTLERWSKAFATEGFAGLIDRRERSGRKRKLQINDAEKAALRAARLVTNRTAIDGSSPEAVRLAMRRGQLRPEVAAEFMERERNGRMLTASIHKEITAPAAVVKQHRNPSEAGLDYLNAPGSLMWIKDERTGEDRFLRVGDILEADDATVNFHVCVPWEIGGDPCSERWGVRVARFQWLVAIDRASRFVPGWSYTMRPRSSYRAEDALALFYTIFRQHGVWLRACLERGVWEANLVSAMLEMLHITRRTAWSPHQKPFIEGLFNLMWTKLSDLPGQVGRFQGEEEESNRVAESCRRGATDPRLHFPMLAPALEAFRRVTVERNTQSVKTNQWGTWVPEERWLAQQAEARTTGRLRPLPQETAWLFSPCMRKWTVAGNTVGGSVQIMEGLSVQFDFAAEWLVNFAGAVVHVHFDPAAPRAEATIVLAQNMRDHRKGEVLGTAYQVNKTARYARKAMGWGDDEDVGLDMRKQAACALRREVRSILAGGQTGASVSEARDGLGNALVIERSAGPDASPEQPPAMRRGAIDLAPRHRATNPFAPATPEQFEKQAALNARINAARQKVEAMAGQT